MPEHPLSRGRTGLLLQPPDCADAARRPRHARRRAGAGCGDPAAAQTAPPIASSLGQWFWADDDQFDIGHHIRHDALAHPGVMD
ncbi:hypothetical protein GS456_18515 [Rhodococcus hoagii]|nr:hypothetical protein [Prescottella equi]